jgi:recombination associated protein RdgC
MPALRGSLTYARFFVQGDAPPDDFVSRAMRSIRARAMKPLTHDEDDLERSGWCTLGEPFELDLQHDAVFYNEYINLGFRTDRWVIPSPMLRAKLKEAEASYLQKKGRDKLSRAEKKELKEVVTRKLRKDVAPAMSVIDCSWALNDGLVRFFSHSPKKGALMMELFERTFGLKLISEAPYTLAARLLDKPASGKPSAGKTSAGKISRVKDSEHLWEGIEPTYLNVQDAPTKAQTRKEREHGSV